MFPPRPDFAPATRQPRETICSVYKATIPVESRPRVRPDAQGRAALPDPAATACPRRRRRDRAESIEPGAKDAKDAAAADRALHTFASVKAIVDRINHRLASFFSSFLKMPHNFLQHVLG